MAVDRRRNEDFKRDEDRTRGSSSSSTPNTKYDDPPNSRLFIVCGKQIDEEQFKEAFGAYGKIEEVWLLKDRHTKAPKGIAYIKFSKTSEAATAMEEMNGRCIANCPRPLKVLIAHARDQGSKRELNEEERLVIMTGLDFETRQTAMYEDAKSALKKFKGGASASVVKNEFETFYCIQSFLWLSKSYIVCA